MRFLRWLPTLLWMAVIMVLSTDAFSADQTGAVLVPSLRWLAPWATPAQIEMAHAVIRKLAHFGEYAILATLWFETFQGAPGWSVRRAQWVAFGISVAWAFLDEAHQATTLTRTASARDVVLDAAGAVSALALLAFGSARAQRPSDLQPRVERVAQAVAEQVDP